MYYVEVRIDAGKFGLVKLPNANQNIMNKKQLYSKR